MLFTAFFLLVTAFSAAALLLFLTRAGAARAINVWALAALLPVLAAMTASFNSQARAARTLQGYLPQPASVGIVTAGRLYRAALTADEAACLERNLRLNWQGQLNTPQGFIPIDQQSLVRGELPPTSVVEALSVQGRLKCASFNSQVKKQTGN